MKSGGVGSVVYVGASLIMFGFPLLGYIAFLISPSYVENIYYFSNFSDAFLLAQILSISFLFFSIFWVVGSGGRSSVYGYDFNRIKNYSNPGVNIKIAVILLAVFIVVVLREYFYTRVGQRVNEPGFFGAISNVIGVALFPVLGYLCKGSIYDKLIFSFIFFVLLCLYASKASRVFPLGILEFSVIYLINNKNSVSKYFKIFLIIVVTYVCFCFVLVSRQLPTQGFLVFLSYFINDFSVQVVFDKSSEFFFNLTSSFFITAQTMKEANWLGLNDFYMFVNPLPGNVVGWYEQYWKYRVNAAIPYSSVGELINLGIGYPFVLFSIIGFMLSRNISDLQARRGILYKLFSLLGLMMMLQVVFIVGQYNTRSVLRPIYYCVFLEFAKLVLRMNVVRSLANLKIKKKERFSEG